MKKLTLAYFGTPYFSARFLEKLLNDQSINRLITIKLVVTQPNKPVGRKQILTPSPVKQVAKKYGIEVYENEIENCDLALLYAYGEIIPKELLSIHKYGFWNIHPSLLPKYRGASPIAYPLILGDKKTGVTIIKMDEKIDHGPIIAQEEIAITPTDRRPDLEIKLTDLAFKMFKKIILYRYGQGSALSLQLKPQNHSQATYARLLKKDDGFIPLTTFKKALNNEPLSPEGLPEIIKNYLTKYPREKAWFLKTFNVSRLIFNLFRGLYPWPGLWTTIPPLRWKWDYPKRLKITDCNLVEGKLIIKKVQLEGKKETNFVQFNQIYKVF